MKLRFIEKIIKKKLSFYSPIFHHHPILSGRSIWSFTHLEFQNPSFISDFRHRDRMVRKKSEKEQQQEESTSIE